MAFEHDAYAAALRESRRRGLILGRDGLEELRRVYAQVLARIEAGGNTTAALSGARAEELGKEIRALLRAVDTRMAGISTTTARAVSVAVTDAHRTVLADLSSRYQQTGLTGRLTGTSAKALIAAIGGPSADTFKTISRRHLGEAVRDIDMILRRAVAAGVSAGETTADLVRIMAVNDPEIVRLMPGPSTLHRGGFGRIDLTKYGLSPGQVSGARTLLYDARRIAVSQANNTLRETNRQALLDSDLILAARWQLSGRHSDPDECDILAESDLYGYGPGMYPPHDWPAGPHPFCGCTQAGPVRVRPPSTWNQPAPAPPPPRRGGLRVPEGAERRERNALRALAIGRRRAAA